MAHWNSTDLNWKIFNDVNQRRANVTLPSSRSSSAATTPTPSAITPSPTATTSSATASSTRLPKAAATPGRTRATTTLGGSQSTRRTTPPIPSAFGGTTTSRPVGSGANERSGSQFGGGRTKASGVGSGGGLFASSPRPMQTGRGGQSASAAITTTVPPIIASSATVLSTLLYGQQQHDNNNNSSKLIGRGGGGGQDVTMSPVTSSRSGLPVVDGNRTMYNQYVDTFANLTTTGVGQRLRTAVSGVDGDRERSRGAEGGTIMGRGSSGVISSSLANFSTSESSESLLDTDNGSRNGAGDPSDKDIELNFRGGSNFMLLLEDFGEYFYNFNGTTGASGGGGGGVGEGAYGNFSGNYDFPSNCSLVNSTCGAPIEIEYNYWALLLILFPFLTLFGNVLVILSVCRERTLQTVTNYFIVSLAIADLLVAVVVMPFGVYILVNGAWSLPNVVCDFYIAMDVICSTSSIFNLVAISIDRYIAVTQPIKYAKHKNSRRVCLTILLVWAISAAIGSPIVLGLNNTPDRVPDLCVFYNSDFIVYSSLSSFYIPCIIMVFLYWNIFKALRSRARKQRAARKPHLSDLTTGGGGCGGGGGGSIIENVAQTRKLAETTLDSSKSGSKILPDEERPTNTASGSNEEEDDQVGSPDVDDCHVIANDKSTEFILATVVEEAGNVMAQITSPSKRNATSPAIHIDPNGNQDSGYAPSNIDDIVTVAPLTPPGSPRLALATVIANRAAQTHHENNSTNNNNTSSRNGAHRSPKKESHSVAMRPLSFMRSSVQDALSLARNDSTLSTNSRGSRKDKKNSQASRFTIYKVHKASKKKREKSSAKKERKATKTLAIVLGVFLICWVPFFTCNIMDAMCAKLDADCRPGVTVFILTTWLGYMNSFVNPVIYTIFNPEFRKAFKKIMHIGS